MTSQFVDITKSMGRLGTLWIAFDLGVMYNFLNNWGIFPQRFNVNCGLPGLLLLGIPPVTHFFLKMYQIVHLTTGDFEVCNLLTVLSIWNG